MSLNQKKEWRKELRQLLSQRRRLKRDYLLQMRRFERDLKRLETSSSRASRAIHRRIAILEGRLA